MVIEPEFAKEYSQFAMKLDSIKKFKHKSESELMHGEEGGMIYKYDLPVINSPISFFNKLIKIDEEKAALTEVQKLFEILDCDKDTAYESFMIKFS